MENISVVFCDHHTFDFCDRQGYRHLMEILAKGKNRNTVDARTSTPRLKPFLLALLLRMRCLMHFL